MVRIEINTDDFLGWYRRLISRVEKSIPFAVKRGSRKMTEGYRSDIRRGLNADGSPMTPVTQNTMDMPVRLTTDRRQRRSVNPSVNPMSATGATARSIKDRRVGEDEYLIYSDSVRGNNVLVSNANPGIANSGAIKARRVKRDPLQVSDKQIKIIEDEILKELDKALR